jgi:cyclic pyranopterin phosphate synthase
LGLTTNATLLAPLAKPLREVGLKRINIGLSAVTPAVYERITRGGRIEDALAGLRAALDAGFAPVKLNVVLMRGVNDAEIPALAQLTRDDSLEVRFVEYMPFLPAGRRGTGSASLGHEGRGACPPIPSGRGQAPAVRREPVPVLSLGHEGRGACPPIPRSTETSSFFVSAEEALARLGELGQVEPLPGKRGPASAQRFRIRGYRGTVGIIAPHSEPFCRACNRIRLTADGKLRACLIEGGEQDALPLIRRGLDRTTMQRLLAAAAAMKPTLHAGSFRGEMHRIGG